MKKTFIAFWDLLIGALVCAALLSIAIYIFVVVKGDADWDEIPLHYTIICAGCIAVPTTIMLSLQRMTIDLSCDKVELFYLVNYNINGLDLHSNWIIYPSEIESIEVVNLSKEEKRQYTSARFLFSKYLKITMRYGHCKYVYVSHYSNAQINKIIKLLMSNKQ